MSDDIFHEPERRSRKKTRSRRKVRDSGGGKRGIKGFFSLITVRLPARLYRWLLASSWPCALPLFLLLCITGTDFLILTHISDAAQNLFFDELPVPYNDSRRDAAELLKTNVLQYVYVLLFFLCVLHWREVLGYLREWPHFILIFLLLLSGVFYSLDPVKVVTNSILIFIGILAAVLFSSAYARRGHYNAMFQAVFWPFFFIQIASLCILTLYDIDIIEFLLSTRRYGGLAGNPNSLGTTAVLGVWASAGMVLSSDSTRSLRFTGIFGLLVFFLNTALSGSGTSTVAIILVLAALIWLKFLSTFRPKVRLLINGLLVLLAVILGLYALLLSTPAEMYLGITGSMGKDATLTGRTELWAIAKEAISLKPILGWGFDSHLSVMDDQRFDVRYNHYHNGFLDTIVAGGYVLLGLVVYNLSRFVHVFLRVFRIEPRVFPLLMPLIMVLILNLSEYSLLRPNSQLWLVYLITFAMLTYNPLRDIAVRFSLGRKSELSGSGRSKKKRKQLRWV